MGLASARARATARVGEASGQTIVLVVVAMVVFIGMLGMALDVGYAFYVSRTMQSAADAAALAGAGQLPDTAAAVATAKQYGGAPGGKNAPKKVQNAFAETVTTKCVRSLPGCAPANAVTVDETARVDTFFARVLGIPSYTIHAHATACGVCAGRPADIVLVFDRTGSMCTNFDGSSDPSCTKLQNARTGMETLVGSLDPGYNQVGLAVLPPANSLGQRCSTPSSTVYNSTSSPYLLVPLSTDYKTGSALNKRSNLVSTIECLPAGGSTAYAVALEKAEAELEQNGRKNVDHVIVFFTDGAANTGPTYFSTSSPYRTQPCHQGVTSANAIKAKGTIIFTIGYGLDANGGGANICTSYTGARETGITAYTALQQISSKPEDFFVQDSGSLVAVFAQIATMITGPRLIPDNLQ
jgi:Flp pilus assembly protein TadG